MAVNVAFGPSAGIGGALAFGTGKRKYSDKKAQIEHQSKRQMLSDAMGFAKFLQDTRRPEEDQRRSMERMDKQQDIAQENLVFEQDTKQKAVQWDLDFKNKARNDQMDALEAATQKINEEAETKKAANIPEQHIAKWRNEAIGNSRARILGTSPPQPRNPYDGAVQFAGQEWFSDPNTGKYVNATEGRVASELKQKELDIRTQAMVNDAVSKGTARVLSTFEKPWERLEKAYDALEDEYSESKLEENYESSAKKVKYEAAKRALDIKHEALDLRQSKALRRMESSILAPHAVQGGGKDSPANIFSLRLGQIQQEEKLDLYEREESRFLDLARKGDSTELGHEIMSRTSTPRSEDDPLAPFGAETSSERGLELAWGGAEWPEADPKAKRGAGMSARIALPHSGGSIDGNLYSQIGLDDSGALASAAIRKGLLTPEDAGTILAEAKSGKRHKGGIRVKGKEVLFTGTQEQTVVAAKIAEDVDLYQSKSVAWFRRADEEGAALVVDKKKLAELAREISDLQYDRFQRQKSGDGVDPAGQDSDAKLNKEIEALKAEYEKRIIVMARGDIYPNEMQLPAGATSYYEPEIMTGGTRLHRSTEPGVPTGMGGAGTGTGRGMMTKTKYQRTGRSKDKTYYE